MKGRMLSKDLRRNWIINTIVALFIVLSALLVSLATALIIDLTGAMSTLFEDSHAPHFVQMHSGEINQEEIDVFTSSIDYIESQQTVEMLNVNGKHITLGDSITTQASSVMEIAFVVQNQEFDYLVDADGKIADVSLGEVGIPIYFMEQNNLQLGDTVIIDGGEKRLELTITCFIRDVQMNPSLVSSKRLLVHDTDWQMIKDTVGSSEYLIEFLLERPTLANDLEQQYVAANLPANGTAITHTLYQMLNAISDGLVVAVLILIGILLILISILCIRYTIIGSLEEDIREIGIMKAIGLSSRDIRSIYFTKYVSIAGIACMVGYSISLLLGGLLTKNITLYMATPARTWISFLMPLLSVGLVFLFIAGIVRMILRRVHRLSTTEAMRMGNVGDITSRKRRISLKRSWCNQVNVILALQDIWLRLKSYILLGFIFVICTFLALIPVNLYSTIQSPDFISYMGTGMSDLRIDLQNQETMVKDYEQIVEYLDTDSKIAQYSAFITGTFQVENAAGNFESLKVETGDFSIFPLEYQDGKAPEQEYEIALSVMNADELEKSVGDTLSLIVKDQRQEMLICGIYQDVTNGGKTAKAKLSVEVDNIVWYVININVQAEVDIQDKKIEYSQDFSNARVLDMGDYLEQTLGSITNQIQVAAIGAVIVTVVLSILITAMFFHMMLAKDITQRTIMKCLGFTNRDIYIQYIVRALIVLVMGILIGTILAGILGETLASLLLGMMGANNISFIINPWISYLGIPILLLSSVVITTLLSSRLAGRTINLTSITE